MNKEGEAQEKKDKALGHPPPPPPPPTPNPQNPTTLNPNPVLGGGGLVGGVVFFRSFFCLCLVVLGVTPSANRFRKNQLKLMSANQKAVGDQNQIRPITRGRFLKIQQVLLNGDDNTISAESGRMQKRKRTGGSVPVLCLSFRRKLATPSIDSEKKEGGRSFSMIRIARTDKNQKRTPAVCLDAEVCEESAGDDSRNFFVGSDSWAVQFRSRG